MNAKIIADDLYNFLQVQDGTYGKVHSIFRNTVNLQTVDDTLISLFSESKDITPMSLIIAKEFDKFALEKDMEVIFNHDAIVFPDIKKRIVIKSTPHWDSRPESVTDLIQKRTYLGRLDRFERLLFEKGHPEGILHTAYYLNFDHFDVKPKTTYIPKLNDYSQFICERLQSFLEGVALHDLEISGLCLTKIIGFGPGLTPSVDDFIAGIMAGGYYLSNYYHLKTDVIVEFNKHLLKNALGKTTIISEQMLKHAAIGLISNQYRDVLLSLYHQLDIKIEISVEKALNFGETSGTDFLLGVYIINKMFLNKKIREVYNGG